VAVTVLLCYDRNRKDERMAGELNKHFSALKRNGIIEVWDYGSISPGTDWQQQMKSYLSKAQIILLLISSSFLDSGYCYDKVMQKAIERHECKEACVIPVLLRPVHWKKPPLGILLPLPDHEKPISRWPDRDEAYTNVIDGIEKVIEQLKTERLPDPPAERKAIMANLDQLIANVKTRLQPEPRAQATANTLEQLSAYIPVDVTLADLVLGWRVLSRPAQPQEDIATTKRRATCSELADLASELTSGQGNLQRAIKTWDAWSKMFAYRENPDQNPEAIKDENDPRRNAMTKTFTRELSELKAAR
jgi:TIR domain